MFVNSCVFGVSNIGYLGASFVKSCDMQKVNKRFAHKVIETNWFAQIQLCLKEVLEGSLFVLSFSVNRYSLRLSITVVKHANQRCICHIPDQSNEILTSQ